MNKKQENHIGAQRYRDQAVAEHSACLIVGIQEMMNLKWITLKSPLETLEKYNLAP